MFELIFQYPVWFSCFCYRYLRLFVNAVAFLCHRTIPIPEDPSLTSHDVTVVIPSLGGDGLEDTIFSILDTDPFEVILVTIDANRERAQNMVDKMQAKKVKVLAVPQPNKRRQMVCAIPEVQTAVTIFADDDVTWGPKLLPWMLAPLEDEKYGGVGTNQWLRDAQNPSFQERIWSFLNVTYLQRRNFDCAACNCMDGGLPCLSGRTVAYRTNIIREEAFMDDFTNEVWGFGRNYRLNADDDNFITRWLVSHGHEIAFQYHREAEVLTELEANPKFLKQCLRWSRSNWRSNITSMFVDGQIWSRHPWSVYAVFLTTFTHWAPLWDLALWYYCPPSSLTFWLLLTTMASSKLVKLLPLFLRDPTNILFAPISIVFGQLHALIKLYAASTLHVTAWGSREGADENDAYRMIQIKHAEHFSRPSYRIAKDTSKASNLCCTIHRRDLHYVGSHAEIVKAILAENQN